ncbi:hypothetical protein F4804DRAFT_234400 [Jackrogersella minutella]|nr:hypothetical protein F4804DRAFT_234400 [Jackrogersella minutella]
MSQETNAQDTKGGSANSSGQAKSVQATLSEILQHIDKGERQAHAVEARLDRLDRNLDAILAQLEGHESQSRDATKEKTADPKEKEPEAKK